MSSPPAYNPLSVPRKRQSINLLSSNPKRRKPSTGPSLLRQASFPPPSPTGPDAQYSRSPSPVDSVAVGSVVSGMTAATGATGTTAATTNTATAASRKKYQQQQQKKKGKKGTIAASSSAAAARQGGDNGDAESQFTVEGSSSRRGGGGGGGAGGSVAAGYSNQADQMYDEDGEEDDGDENNTNDVIAEGKTDEAAKRQEREQLNMLIEAFNEDQEERYLVWRRVRLKKDTIRKIVNHTLSQSVPPSVITTVNGYTKIFIGEIIEKARQVQLEWLAAADTWPNGDPIPAGTPLEDRTRQCHRGPLTPDHLREALRRYRLGGVGGGAGVTGYSTVGAEAARARVGGRRIFR